MSTDLWPRPRSSSPSPIAGFRAPEPPALDLPVPLRWSKPVKKAVGEAIQGAYLGGAADGYAVGQTVGYVGGHAAGVLEGTIGASVIAGLLFYVVGVFFSRGQR